MEEINASNFIVVQTSDGGIFQTQDGICVQNGTIYFVPPTQEILNLIEPSSSQTSICSQGGASASTTERSEITDEQNKRVKWSKDAILTLIKLRIQYDKEFQSTTSKNEVTWKKISEELKNRGYNMSTTQCNDKWRYLKGRYTSKKDNMGDRGTGESPYDFAYFEEMDAFLGQKHNIKPPAIASSIRGDTLEESEEDDSIDNDVIEPPRKKKMGSSITKSIKRNKAGLQVVMEQIKESSKDRELARERRHKENLTARDNAVRVFSEKIDALIDALKK